MKINKAPITLILMLFLILAITEVKACSMYKVTVDGKTMVGCNEDNWRTTSRIWFQNARNGSEYGVGFTGSRKVAENVFAPQSGMNEVGLTFSRLTAYYPKQNIDLSGKLSITSEVDYLTDILHKCATVEEVKKHIEQYDHSIFIDDVFIYIDSLGKYLIVEPYNLIVGNDPNYVLSNFCPSITDNVKARKLERYRNGEDFLKKHNIDASLELCSALSDTMHVCRSRNGDGTLLTSIWDTKDKLVNLYFYHNYDATVQFNLIEELEKGNRIHDVAALFPVNAEFKRLADYKTPFNTPALRFMLAIVGGILPLVALVFLVFFIRNRKAERYNRIFIIASILNVILAAYFFVLATNIGVYYFDAPYKHYSSTLISTSSYIPFLLLLVIAPILFLTIRFVKKERKKYFIKGLLVVNNLVYLASILGFGYWGLFNFLS